MLLCVVAFSMCAYSQGNIKLGTLNVHPSFSEKVTFDDNIYQISGKGTNGSKNSDIINTITPGLGLELPIGAGQVTGKHVVGLNWFTDFVNYRDNADQNQQNHTFNATGSFEFARGFTISFNDNYVDTWGTAGSDTDKLHPRITNTATVNVSLPDYFRRFDVDLTYENYNQEYDEFALRRANRNRSKFTVKVPFELAPTITIFPEWSYDQTFIKNESLDGGLSDSHGNSLYAGMVWQATAKTLANMKFGWSNRDFQKETVSDINTFAMQVGVISDLSERTRFTFNLNRDEQISEFTTGANGFVETGGKFSLSHTIRKITAKINGGYEKSVFRDSQRKDDTYDAGAR